MKALTLCYTSRVEESITRLGVANCWPRVTNCVTSGAIIDTDSIIEAKEKRPLHARVISFVECAAFLYSLWKLTMKSRTMIFILIAAALLIGVGISIKRYWIREAGSVAQALWHDNECFVFVSAYSMGWSGSLLEEVLVPLGEKLDIIRDLPEPLGSNLTLYYYVEGRLETYDLKDQYLGEFVVFNGRLHCLSYGDDEDDESFASGWRWTGAGFEPLSEAEVKEIAKALGKEDDDPLKKAGWSRADVSIYSRESEKSYPIHLRSAELTLTMKREGEIESIEDFALPSKATIALSGPGINEPVLREFSYDWQRVDEARYQKVAGTRARNQTMFGRRTIFLGLGGLLVYLIHTVVSLVGMKGKVVKSVPQNFQFLPTTPDQFPGLDVEALRRYTEAFESLGFVRLRDYTLADDSVKLVATSFGRLFANRERGCFAEVGQVFPKGKKPMPMGCMLGSLMEDGWSLATTDRQPQAISYMMRRPRSLWTSHPKGRPTELMHYHLERRRQMAYELGVKVIEDVSAETFFAHERRESADRQQALKRRNLAIGLAEAGMFKLKPKHEWMGEYPLVAARKKEPWKYAGRA